MNNEIENNKNNNNGQVPRSGSGNGNRHRNHQKTGQQRKVESSISKPFIQSSDIDVTNRIVIAPERCGAANIGVEVHSPHGFICECFDVLRRKYEMKASMKTEPEQYYQAGCLASDFVNTLEAGEIAYVAASATTTSDPLCEDRKLFLNGPNGKLLIDEELFEVFNAFMPIDRCVQLNVFHNYYILHRVRNAVQTSPLWGELFLDQTTPDQMKQAQEVLMDAGESNPLLQVVKEVLAFEKSIVVRNDGEIQAIARFCPQFAYRVEEKAAEIVLDVSSSVHTKMNEYQHEHKMYRWKVVNPAYAVVVNNQNEMCADKVDTKITFLLMRVQATLFYTQPKVRIIPDQLLASAVRMPYTQSLTREGVDSVKMQEIVEKISSLELDVNEVNNLPAPLKELCQSVQIPDFVQHKEKVIKPRLSITHNEGIEKKDAKAPVRAQKDVKKEGHRVMLQKGVYYIPHVLFKVLSGSKAKLGVQKQFLQKAVDSKGTQIGALLVLSAVETKKVIGWLKKDEFDDIAML